MLAIAVASKPAVGLTAVMFDTDQPPCTPSLTTNLNAVQMECTARKLDRAEYNEAVQRAIDALQPPMPPYEVFMLTPSQFYVPAIDNVMNIRCEVDLG